MQHILREHPARGLGARLALGVRHGSAHRRQQCRCLLTCRYGVALAVQEGAGHLAPLRVQARQRRMLRVQPDAGDGAAQHGGGHATNVVALGAPLAGDDRVGGCAQAVGAATAGAQVGLAREQQAVRDGCCCAVPPALALPLHRLPRRCAAGEVVEPGAAVGGAVEDHLRVVQARRRRPFGADSAAQRARVPPRLASGAHPQLGAGCDGCKLVGGHAQAGAAVAVWVCVERPHADPFAQQQVTAVVAHRALGVIRVGRPLRLDVHAGVGVVRVAVAGGGPVAAAVIIQLLPFHLGWHACVRRGGSATSCRWCNAHRDVVVFPFQWLGRRGVGHPMVLLIRPAHCCGDEATHSRWLGLASARPGHRHVLVFVRPAGRKRRRSCYCSHGGDLRRRRRRRRRRQHDLPWLAILVISPEDSATRRVLLRREVDRRGRCGHDSCRPAGVLLARPGCCDVPLVPALLLYPRHGRLSSRGGLPLGGRHEALSCAPLH